jgi:hypothetical protein
VLLYSTVDQLVARWKGKGAGEGAAGDGEKEKSV